MKSLILIIVIVLIFLSLNKKEHFGTAAFHSITLNDRTNNIYSHLNKTKKLEKFGNIKPSESFNPSKYVVFPYSSWELKAKNDMKGRGSEQAEQRPLGELAVKRENLSGANFMKNDAGSGINLDKKKADFKKNRTQGFDNHKTLILERGGNKAK